MSTDLQDSAFTEGNILFLKKLSQIDEDLFCSYNIPEGALFHPALVIQLTEEKKDVQVCILTTLNDHDLDVRRDLSFERFIAIHPKAPLWKDLRQLCLMNGVEMRKEGYLDVRKSYTVHRSMLMPYDWISRPDHYRLTARIYAEVAEILKIKTVVRIEDRYTHQMTRLKHLETELMKLKAENERLNERLHRKLRGMRSTKKLENHEGTEGVAEASQINSTRKYIPGQRSLMGILKSLWGDEWKHHLEVMLLDYLRRLKQQSLALVPAKSPLERA